MITFFFVETKEFGKSVVIDALLKSGYLQTVQMRTNGTVQGNKPATMFINNAQRLNSKRSKKTVETVREAINLTVTEKYFRNHGVTTYLCYTYMRHKEIQNTFANHMKDVCYDIELQASAVGRRVLRYQNHDN